VNRVVRSASVATCDLPRRPMIRSPSQCPGTARSATSGGRWLMVTIPAIRACLGRVLPRGMRSARPVRSATLSCVASSPRPCRCNAWQMVSCDTHIVSSSGWSTRDDQRSAPATSQPPARPRPRRATADRLPAYEAWAAAPSPRPAPPHDAPIRRYADRPPLRAISREITDGSRPNRAAICRADKSRAIPREISSRSSNVTALPRTPHPFDHDHSRSS